MKKRLFLCLLGMLALSAAFALEGEVVYVEGTVDLQYADGGMDYADIGMPVETGDTVITGFDGYAELELEDGSTVKVNEESIFLISAVKTDDGTKNNFQLLLGSAGYKFTKAMKEEEPSISTPSTVCGLRGTSFTVLAGLDGSVLYAVEEGSIAVSSQGQEVELGAEEAVRVPKGQVPGEPFKMLEGKVDYSSFKAESQAAFLEDPAASVLPLIAALEDYADDADEYEAIHKEYMALLPEMYARRDTLEGDAKKKYYQEKISPNEKIVSRAKYNVRYFALSALSMRRFVLGTMYVEMRTRYIKDPENPVYLEFLDAYRQFLAVYETRIVPYLVEGDIK